MASASHVQLSETGPFWTNQRHVRFLNSMEASFVRSMLHNHRHRRPPRLDRPLPDAADSTRGGRMDGRSSTRSRRVSSLPYISIQDQVVPQMENKAMEDENEKDHPVTISPLN